MNGYGLWLAVVACGVVTLLIRAAFIVLPPSVRLPDWAGQALRYVAAAVLPALVVPAVLFSGLATGQGVNMLRVIAALLALIVALVSRSVFATMGVGMLALWLLQWWGGL